MDDYDRTMNTPSAPGGWTPTPGGNNYASEPTQSGFSTVPPAQQGGAYNAEPTQSGFSFAPEPQQNPYYYGGGADQNGGIGYAPPEGTGSYPPNNGGGSGSSGTLKWILIACSAVVLVLAAVILIFVIRIRSADPKPSKEDETTEEAQEQEDETAEDAEAPAQTDQTVPATDAMVPLTDPTVPITAPPVTAPPTVYIPPTEAPRVSGPVYRVDYDTVLHDGLTLRAGPTSNSEALAVVPEGALVEYAGAQSGSYAKVNYYPGGRVLTGWLWIEHLIPDNSGRDPRTGTVPTTPPTAPPQVSGGTWRVVNTQNSNLNMRSAANANAAVVARIPKGTMVQVYDYDYTGSWAHVYYQGVYGWVSARYLSVP